MTRWIVWSLLLAASNGSGTLASRARNTRSFTYHFYAALLSHSTFFVSSLIGVNLMVEIISTHNLALGVKGFLVYAGASTAGSLGMHWLAMNIFEDKPNDGHC